MNIAEVDHYAGISDFLSKDLILSQYKRDCEWERNIHLCKNNPNTVLIWRILEIQMIIDITKQESVENSGYWLQNPEIQPCKRLVWKGK